MLSKSNYQKLLADPRKSAAAKDGAYTRSKNERRIQSLERRLRRLELALQDIEVQAAESSALLSSSDISLFAFDAIRNLARAARREPA